MSRETTPNKSVTAIWIEAMRPRTLPLAVSSIIMGGFLAAAADEFRWSVVLLAGITAVLLQILSNLANDYGDSIHGADKVATRQGPRRAVQSGLISATTMKRAVMLCAGLAMISGLGLLATAFGLAALPYVLLFALLGAAAIGAAITYTAGRLPYGYAGLGDIAVLIFFGWVGVLGSYFLQTLRLEGVLLLPASSCGLLAVAVLNVNNIRDLESDRQAGKRSLPVRLGPQRARVYHWLLLGGAVGTAVAYVLLTYHSPWQLLFLLTLPLLWQNGRTVSRVHDPLRLNPMLKQLSLSTLLFIIMLGLGQWFA